MRGFTEIDTNGFQHQEIFLDVDGTLVADKVSGLTDERIVYAVRRLVSTNTVNLLSNGGSLERDLEIASRTGATVLSSKAYKPFSRWLLHLRPQPHSLVIGDKCLTDGLFALSMRAAFLKVRRIRKYQGFRGQSIVDYIDDAAWMIFLIFKSVRPLQQVRNFLIFAPLFFARELFDAALFTTALEAFLAFTLLVCAVYIGNDLYDRESDQQHPQKRFRPIASGDVSQTFAYFLLGIFLSSSLLVAYILIPHVVPLFMLYLGLNVWYTLSLKHQVVADIVLVASLYIVRIEVGGIATGISLSSWLIMTTFFLALFLVVGKRYAEVRGSAIRQVSRVYSETYLNILLTLCATSTLLSYSVYCILGVANEAMVYSVIPVVIALFRYLFLLQGGEKGESPERIIFRDRMIVYAVIAWVAFTGVVFYM